MVSSFVNFVNFVLRIPTQQPIISISKKLENLLGSLIYINLCKGELRDPLFVKFVSFVALLTYFSARLATSSYSIVILRS